MVRAELGHNVSGSRLMAFFKCSHHASLPSSGTDDDTAYHPYAVLAVGAKNCCMRCFDQQGVQQKCLYSGVTQVLEKQYASEVHDVAPTFDWNYTRLHSCVGDNAGRPHSTRERANGCELS